MTMSTRETIARVIFRFHFWFLTKHSCTCDMALGLATLSRHHACLAQLHSVQSSDFTQPTFGSGGKRLLCPRTNFKYREGSTISGRRQRISLSLSGMFNCKEP